MNMKVFLYSILLLGGACMASCSNDDAEKISTGNANLMVDLGTDFSFKSSGSNKSEVSRAIDESKFTDVNNYTVTLTKTSDNSVVNSALYSDWDLIYPVDVNTEYTLTASYGSLEPASYDNLLVTGSQTFSIDKIGDTRNVDIQCKPVAAKVNVLYSDDFSTYYSDCVVSIKTKHMSSAWDMAKADTSKDLYIQADATGEEVTLNFDLKKDGVSVVPEGFTTTKVVTVKPQTWLKITIKPNVTEIEGGKFGINVTVNTDVTDEDVNITIPNTVFQ